ncbi:MAG: aminopeptidase P family protein [Rhodospirillales bacterium]|nr:aminopeptidase P family protein [Rhodospirillales bacterium]
MALHFSETELAGRRKRACDAMVRDGLDGLLMFRQESMFYLTGYDTFGYCFFQCLYLGADGRLTLLTRAPDLRQAQHTSMIKDIRIWVDDPKANPSSDLKRILAEHGCTGKRLGVEWEAYGLTARNGQRLAAALEGFCTTADASELVSRLRVIKSPAEMAYVRRAAELADAALYAAAKLTKPGVSEGTILAAMQGAVFEGGGDYPGNEFIIGSGRDALLCRYYTGRRTLESTDQLTLEWAGVYRHYHACLMRTFPVGKPPAVQVTMFEAARDALQAVKEALVPGRTIGEAFDAHARVLDAAGLGQHRLNACGYSMGTTFSPTWMDWPMLYHDNPVVVTPGMVLFLHMIIMNSDAGFAVTLGETVAITGKGHERLSKAPLELMAS